MAPIRLQTALVGCLAAAFLVFTFITFRSEFQREISSIRASIEEWQHPVRNTRDDLERQDIDLDLLRFEHRSLLYLMGLNRIARGKMRTPRPYENCRLRMELYKDGKKIAEHRDGDWLGNEGCKFRNVLVQSLAVKEPDGAVSALVAARVSEDEISKPGPPTVLEWRRKWPGLPETFLLSDPEFESAKPSSSRFIGGFSRGDVQPQDGYVAQPLFFVAQFYDELKKGELSSLRPNAATPPLLLEELVELTGKHSSELMLVFLEAK